MYKQGVENFADKLAAALDKGDRWIDDLAEAVEGTWDWGGGGGGGATKK